MSLLQFARGIGRLFGAAADILFPELCLLCGRAILPGKRAGPYPLCADCGRKLPLPAAPRCRLCSRPLITEKDLCMSCRRPRRGGKASPEKEPVNADGFPFEHNHSLFVYQDPGIAELVVSFKGRGRRSLAVFFAEKLLACYKDRWDGLPLVPVPCRKSSLKKRGFDPVGLLCREMRRKGGVRILRLLRRAGKSREQKTLNREERLQNLRGAVIPARRTLPPGTENIVLVDDVFTTGATAAACAETLKKMGVRKVYVLTIALD